MASALYDVGSVIIGEGVITNLDYHREGRWLVMSTNESSIHLIDALSGEEKKKLYSKASGVGVMTYTHHESCILHSSDKNNDIRYLCLYDNRLLRNFPGHQGKVTSISMSPVDDAFLTASDDNTIRLWNLATPNSIAKISLPQNTEAPIAMFDGSGMVFGVLCFDSWKKSNCIKLFDARNYEAGPFQNIVPDNHLLESSIIKSNPSITSAQAQKSLQTRWTGFEFSPDGNHLLVNTLNEQLFLLDGFRSEVEPLVITRKNENNLALAACFSANAKLVITANDENEVLTFDKSTGELKSTQTVHVAPVSCIKSNPKYDQIASGCVNTVLWIPKDSSSSIPE